jgi:serine/threonine-protein kinase HipA
LAKLLWGKVFFRDRFAGILREEAGYGSSFAYDLNYLSDHANVPISYSLPFQEEPHIYLNGLLPFFDNLVAEGWVELAQSRILGKRTASRLELLLAFGFDCIGAISIFDPEPAEVFDELLDVSDQKEMALLTSRASLSGIQPKLAVREKDGKYYPTKVRELSTHIAKFPSQGHLDLMENEYLTTLAIHALLRREQIVEMKIGMVEGINDEALIITRFDRREKPGSKDIERIHFEEFNQLLGIGSKGKYSGQYRDLANFIQLNIGRTTELYRVYRRILAGFILGNTDMHLKNFAMFNDKEGFSSVPIYDQISSILYGYKTLALGIAGAQNLFLSQIKRKHLDILGKEFGLNDAAVQMTIDELGANLEKAKQAVLGSALGPERLKEQIIEQMEKRWKGTFG